MKKVILLVLCFIFILSGCEKLEKAEPYYTETREDVVLTTQYEYYFSDGYLMRLEYEMSFSLLKMEIDIHHGLIKCKKVIIMEVE